MRRLLFCVFLLVCLRADAQNYQSAEVYVHFFSPAPIADIEAVSQAAKANLNTDKKEVHIEIPISSFTFKKAMMQTHFNEKYLESEKYPKASFIGKYKDDIRLDKDGIYRITLTGKFSLHGVTRHKNIPCNITIKNGRITFESSFSVLSADYKIEAPDMLYRTVGEKVDVDVTGGLE
ncbi:hypothetical protein BCY91_12955 [Pelobium manganitolerans]|uniref:Lipid/polyisoprenoid-binding YceI-like domain-containing protein n=1 Tax=Pelobium manganitolerans TaxID=1842495 RepID=A0A419SAN0_9SPHI|nr:YceI family protein [Pelobium manganitolerans]RKD19507.1 hypothetical protein BCY91_12955 [Pelobium manganitolerans]